MGILYGIDSFRNKAALFDNGTLGYIDGQYQANVINLEGLEAYHDFAVVSEDGNDLLYKTLDLRLIKVSNLGGGCRKETLSEQISSVEASMDLKDIYYTSQKILYYINDKKESIKIAEDVNNFILSSSADIVFFTKGEANASNQLFYISKGSEAKPVPGVENIVGLSKWNNYVVYIKEGSQIVDLLNVMEEQYGIVAMGNADQATFDRLKKSGESVYERIVEFPFWEEYGESLKSDIADLKNLGSREGGAINAGKFLGNFVNYPWIHLDIAGPAFLQKADHYRSKGGTGTGLRLLLDFLRNQ
jgi:hypothetical protein